MGKIPAQISLVSDFFFPSIMNSNNQLNSLTLLLRSRTAVLLAMLLYLLAKQGADVLMKHNARVNLSRPIYSGTPSQAPPIARGRQR